MYKSLASFLQNILFYTYPNDSYSLEDLQGLYYRHTGYISLDMRFYVVVSLIL